MRSSMRQVSKNGIGGPPPMPFDLSTISPVQNLGNLPGLYRPPTPHPSLSPRAGRGVQFQSGAQTSFDRRAAALLSFALAPPESADLGLVAARRHRAPAAVAAPRGVDEIERAA